MGLLCSVSASDSGSVQRDPVVIVHPSGLMSTAARQRLTFTCQLRLSLFPFDEQHCNITFSSMSADSKLQLINHRLKYRFSHPE